MLGVLLSLAAAAAPEALPAIDALEALSRYGTVPRCDAREEIVERDGDHQHRRSPPEARFAGKAAELIPFTRHPDRRVVLRAAALLCFEGSADARTTLAALAERWPCEYELGHAAWAVGAQPGARCDARRAGEAQLPLLARAAEVRTWPESDPRRVAALEAGESKAWEEAMAAMTWLDPAASRAAGRALAALHSPRAIRRLLVESARLLKTLGEQQRLGAVLEGVGLLALGAMAQATRTTPEDALLEVLRGASAAEAAVLDEVVRGQHRLLQGKGDAARALLQKAGTTPEGRALLEPLAQREGRLRGDAWFARQDQLRHWEDHRDRPALRAYTRDEARLHADRRAAAQVLAKLGDPGGLFLWESSAGLSEDEYQQRRRELLSLLGQATGAAATEARLLLEKSWSR